MTTFKSCVTNRIRIEEEQNSYMDIDCTKELKQELPPKMGDPGSFLISCALNENLTYNALADLGASINLMPFSIYSKLTLGELKPTNLRIMLIDRSFHYPKGIAENLLINVDNFSFLVDFVILDIPEDIAIPLILGRPFLHTANAIIHVADRKISLGVGDQRITFPTMTEIKHSYSYDETCFRMDVTDNTLSDLQNLLNPHPEITEEPAQWEREQDPNEAQVVDIDELEDWMENFTVDEWSDENEMLIPLPVLKIRTFGQGNDESIEDAWVRMKELVIDCEEFNIARGFYIQYFYHGLTGDAQDLLDITSEEGFFLMSTPDVCYDFMENKEYNLETQESSETENSPEKSELFKEINHFEQKEEESINDAWVRMKNLVEDCMELDVDHGHYFRCFYMGLNVESQDILDMYSREEYFLMKDAEDCFQFLENKKYLEKYPEAEMSDESDPEEEELENESDPEEEGPAELSETEYNEEPEESEVTHQMLIDLLDQQSAAFMQLQTELEEVRSEFKQRNRIEFKVKSDLEQKLDKMLEIQQQSPFGLYRETENVRFSTFVKDLYLKRRNEDELETETTKKQKVEEEMSEENDQSSEEPGDRGSDTPNH